MCVCLQTKLPLSEEADQFMERKNYSHNLDFTLFKEIIDTKALIGFGHLIGWFVAG